MSIGNPTSATLQCGSYNGNYYLFTQLVRVNFEEPVNYIYLFITWFKVIDVLNKHFS